jgi:hypothetical protein
MASIAEQLIAGSQAAGQKAGETALAGFKTGADLALSVDAAKRQREQLEMQKEEVELGKATKIMDAIKAGDNFKDKSAQSNYYKKVVPSMIKAFKMDHLFSPDLMEMMQSSPEVRQKVVGLQLDIQDKINRGELRGNQVIPYAQSKLAPEELPLLDTDALVEQQKFGAQQAFSNMRTQLAADAAAGRQQTQIAAAPETEYKKKVADVAATYNTGGGAAGIEKNVAKMRGVIEKLRNNEIKLGTLAKNLPYGSTEEALSRLDPKAKAAMDDVRGAINMRAALADPNPTAMQVNAIMSRAFDPRLSNEQNIKKLEEAIVELQTAAKDREKEFVKYGFSQASQKRDFKPNTTQLEGFKKLPQDQQMKFLQDAAKKFDIPLEDIRKAMGVK